MEKKASLDLHFDIEPEDGSQGYGVTVTNGKLVIGRSYLGFHFDEQMWHQLQDAVKQLGWPS